MTQGKEKGYWTLIIAYVMSSLNITALLVPMIMIYWLQSGLSFGDVLLLQGIFSLVILTAEIPTGAMSDSWLGRKWTEVLAATLLSTGFIIYALGNNFAQFALAETLLGLGVAAKSGNTDALLYDGLTEKKMLRLI